MHNDIIRRINERKATIGVVGLGYVGLPLALCFNEKGFNVIGMDIDETKTKKLNAGQSYIHHIPAQGSPPLRKANGSARQRTSANRQRPTAS